MLPWAKSVSPNTAGIVWHRVSHKVRWKSDTLSDSDTTPSEERTRKSDIDAGPRILTALHKATNLAPRVWSGTTGELAVWMKALNGVHDDVGSGKQPRERKILVLGGQYSHAQSLVTALLDDPLTSSEQDRKKLRERWRKASSKTTSIHLRLAIPTPSFSECQQTAYRQSSSTSDTPQPSPSIPTPAIPPAPTSDSHTTHIASPFLSRFNAFVTETRLPSDFSILPDFLSADLTLYAVSEATLGTVSRNSTLSSTILVITGDSLGENADPLHMLDALKDRTFVLSNPSRAVEAIDHLAVDPKLASNVAVFTDGYTRSRIADVEDAIRRKLLVPAFQGKETLGEMEVMKFNKARAVLLAAGAAFSKEVRRAKLDVSLARAAIKVLNDRVVSVMADKDTSKSNSSAVKESMALSERTMQGVLNGYTWWKLPFKVDDVGNDVGMAVRGVWCRGLEQKIIFETGLLTALQHSIRSTTSSTLDTLPPGFRSSVLRNSLAQLSMPAYDLHPSSLTAPIHTRLSQLLKYPTASLQIKAQQSVLTTFTSAFFSAGGAYALLFSEWVSMGAETALGVGLLGTVLGLRIGLGIWERGKKAWWRDWHRVEEGLERDLKVVLETTFEKNILAVPRHAAESLEAVVERKVADIEEIEAEVIAFSQGVEEL